MNMPIPLDETVAPVYSYPYKFTDVARTYRNYTPMVPKRLWNADVQEFTRAAARDTPALSENEASLNISCIAKLVLWTVHIAGQPLERAVVFHPSNIESFMKRGAPNLKKRGANDYRLRLLRIAKELAVGEPSVTPTRRLPSYNRFAPYTAKEVVRFRSQGATRSTELRRHNWMTLLSLAAGCGLDVTEIVGLPPQAINVTPESVTVTLAGPNPRTVTCLAAWEDDIKNLLESPLVGDFVFVKEERPTLPSRYVTRFINTVANEGAAFTTERLRSTFIVTHVNANTPVFSLMQALGVKSLSTLERLEEYCRVPSPEEHTAYFRSAEA